MQNLANQRVQRNALLRDLFLFAISCVVIYFSFIVYGLLITLVITFFISRLGGLHLLRRVLAFVFVPMGKDAMAAAMQRNDTLSKPTTEKHSARGEGHNVRWAVSCMQGWRRSMEDAHTTEAASKEGDCGFFAVFDGHCGARVAQFCGENMFSFIGGTDAFRQQNYRSALIEGFVQIDKHLATHPGFRGDRSGCTAVAVLLTPDGDIYCANAGDSRSVLCRDGVAVPLSEDHKPHSPIERQRITVAKHFVWNRRVDGILALSRAIGDFSFKGSPNVPWESQAVTSLPDVQVEKLDVSTDSFLVLACDGIWDVMSNTEVVNYIKVKLAQNVDPVAICDGLMQTCLAPTPFGLGCDNMSVVLVMFKKPNGGGSDSPSLVVSQRSHSRSGSGTSPSPANQSMI